MATVEARDRRGSTKPLDDIGRASVTLEDKYLAKSGRVLMSGIEALVRLVLEQRWLDLDRGFNTSVFITGYEGSPLGGLARRCGSHLQPGLERGTGRDRRCRNAVGSRTGPTAS
jgi:hypothetical protein